MNDSRTMDIVFATTGQSVGQMFGPKPVRSRTHLYQDVYIGFCGKELWGKVSKACRPAGYSFAPRPQYGQLYAFWNENPADPSGFNWDPDQRLRTAIALSRLVRPTSIGFKYAARVKFDTANQIKEIDHGPVNEFLAQAYVAHATKQNWLTDEDVVILKGLLAYFHAVSQDLPERVQRALWNHEFAAAIQWIDVRWTVIATALESLIHTDYKRSTKQFVDRVPPLAARLNLGFSPQDARDAYDKRSSLAHGQKLDTTDDTTTALYCRMEEVLRAAIRTAIEDEKFRDIFRDAARIREEFPLSKNSSAPQC